MPFSQRIEMTEIVAFVIFGLVTGVLLDKLDDRFQITQRVQKLVAQGLARLEEIAEERRHTLLRGRPTLSARLSTT